MTKDDDFMAACCQLCGMHCSVVCFCARVSEERFLQFARRNLRELLSQIRLRLVAVERRRVTDAVNLVDDRFVDRWVRVTDADRQHAAKRVEILVAFVVPDVKTFAFHQSERLLVVSRDGGKKKLFMFANSFG